MEQTLLDTFEGMKMTDRQKNLFADVMVDRIQMRMLLGKGRLV